MLSRSECVSVVWKENLKATGMRSHIPSANVQPRHYNVGNHCRCMATRHGRSEAQAQGQMVVDVQEASSPDAPQEGINMAFDGSRF